MGGMGSGRHHDFNAKRLTEDYISIDVRRLKREGLLEPHKTYSLTWERAGALYSSVRVFTQPHRILLRYSYNSLGGGLREECLPVHFEWTTCHLGGQRPWFLCPGQDCGQRVAILYFAGKFACRNCCDLRYLCQRQEIMDRAASRLDKIRDKLDWKPGYLNGRESKPKGMHWSTYEKLSAQYDRHLGVCNEELRNYFKRVDQKVLDKN